MSRKVVQSIFDLARIEPGRFSVTRLSEFIAQLFAWCKVSEDPSCPLDLSIWKTLLVGEPKGHLRHAFSELEKAEFLNGNGTAFGLDVKLFEDLSHGFIVKSIQTLKSASENKVINYGDVLPVAIGYDSSLDSSALSSSLIDLMVKVSGIGAGDSVYCPFDESFGLARASHGKGAKVYSETSRETRLPYLLNILENTAILHRVGNVISSPAWVEDGRLMTFDHSLVNPPFGMKYDKDIADWFDRFPFKTYYGEVLQIWHVLAQTKKRAVVLVPHSILARTSGGEKDFKEQLIEDGTIEAIIDLPSGIMPKINVQVSLFVLNKESTHGVLFIDASESANDSAGDTHNGLDIDLISKIIKTRESSAISCLASEQECRENDFNLLVNRYVLSTEQRVVKNFLSRQNAVELGELAELIRPQSVKDKDEKESGTEFKEVMVGDLPKAGFVTNTERSVSISEKNIKRAKQQQLSPNDILISVKGTIGKVGLMPDEFEKGLPWIAGQSLQIVRCKRDKHISPIVLYMYLKSPLAQALLSSLATGTVSMVQVRDIKSLPVPIPTVEEQEAIIETFNEQQRLKNQIDELESELGNLLKRHWDLEIG